MMLDLAYALAPQLSAWRREFHRQPELGFQEFKTAARAAEILSQLGCRVRTGVGRTGLVAEIGQGEPIIALRADMDALPIQEANQTDYASQNPGVMHACGHDAHVAMACGAVWLLAQHGLYSERPLPGTVRILIQPSEEVNDAEGLSGAPRMIADGAMRGVRQVIALHVDADTAVGSIRINAGPASGGVDSFFATIYGAGGHGAQPQATIDPIYITGHIILALNAIVSRRLDPFAPAVVSLGSLRAGQAENVIPDQVEISGTIRYTHKDIRQRIHSEIERALALSRSFGGDYALKIVPGNPPMINDPGVVATFCQAAEALLGKAHVLPSENSLGAEDFGCFSEVAPGAMASLGCRIEGDQRILHNPNFDIDEGCLPIGAALLAETTLRLMEQA